MRRPGLPSVRSHRAKRVVGQPKAVETVRGPVAPIMEAENQMPVEAYLALVPATTEASE